MSGEELAALEWETATWNERPRNCSGHWDELTYITKMAPAVQEREPDDTTGTDDETSLSF